MKGIKYALGKKIGFEKLENPHNDEEVGIGIRAIKSIFYLLYRMKAEKQHKYKFYVSYYTVENNQDRKVTEMIKSNG